MSTKTGLLAAVLMGGAAAWAWQKARRNGPATVHRDLNRWEDEGGAVPGPGDAPMLKMVGAGGPNTDVGPTPTAWKFPKA